MTSGEEASIHTELQERFLNVKDNDSFIAAQGETFANTSQSQPEAVEFSWKYKDGTTQKPSKAILTLAEDQGMSVNKMSYTTTEKEISVYNLKINTTYYYTITLDYDGTKYTSDVYTKKITDKAIRNLYIDGVKNVRDIGGYEVDGGVIKQGLLYRSAEFNGEFESIITAGGQEELVSTLGIKSDIDLRRTTDFSQPKDEIYSITESPLGKSVRWVSLPMYFGGTNIYTQLCNTDNIKTFFEYLAEPTNYPAIFHCVRGTDRTGALNYALGALLGMSEEQLIKDYLFSNFEDLGSDPLTTSSISGKGMYVYLINQEEGDTLSQKAANYLIKRTGVSQDTLNSIKNILIEKK